MKSPQRYPLPQSPQEYTPTDENVFRATIEFSYEALRDDMVEIESQTSKESSLAQRRFQFLLMGA